MLKLSIMASARLERKLVGGGLGEGGLKYDWVSELYDGKRALTLKLSRMASARLERNLVGWGLGGEG